jgi:23S rRNA (cytidine1920-2'-O)/16S rRNA (cytidine1409-2'-O)-methyltransferase
VTVLRRRLDSELVRRGLVHSRAQARAEIAAGRVTVAGAPAVKAGRQVAPGEALEVLGPPARYVGRGGEKLAAALDRFAIDPRRLTALDIGSSTGGFTDCLLQAGSARVVAVDVGRGQLHERLRHDPRVDVRESTDIRDVEAASLGGPVQLAVADVSFISLRLVLPALAALVAAGSDVVVLVKPQFEAGRSEADRGRGVIRDPAVWMRVLEEVAAAAAAAGLGIMGAMASPLRGGKGNVEFMLHLRRGEDDDSGAVTPLLAAAVAEAEEIHP